MNTKLVMIATVVPFGFVLLAVAFAAQLYLRRRQAVRIAKA